MLIMVVVSQFLKLHGVWLWSYSTANIASSSNIFMVLRHWIPRSTNPHTIAMAEKANYNENKLRVCVFNDCDHSGSES